VEIKENNPLHCMCGQAKKGKREPPRDIQDVGKTNTSLTTTPTPMLDLGKYGVASGDQMLSVKAIGSHSQLSNATTIVDDIEDLAEKYEPFIPNYRSWLVIIDVNMTDETKNTECTGAVVAPRWIISSRSCVCGDEYGCNILKLKKEQPDHEVYVYPGFQYAKSSDVKPIRVGKILIHQKNFTYSDIALLQLDEDLNYNLGIMPICLPQYPFDNDEGVDAWISGYNFYFHRKVPTSKKCRTISGPKKNSFCKFPFKRKFRNRTTEYKNCVGNPAPIHPECTKLQHEMNWTRTEKLPKGMYKIIIRKDISKDPQREENYPGLKGDILELECHKVIGESGYCGTCLSTAKKGEPGYCGEDQATEEEDKERWEKEKPRPSEWGGWGLCDPMCRQVEFTGYHWSNQPHLKEIMRKISPHKDCREHHGEGENVTRLCLYQEQGLDVQASFKLVNDVFTPVKNHEQRYGLSAVQPSVGDSGAPVFTFMDVPGDDGSTRQKTAAVLLGIISESQYKTLNDKEFASSEERDKMSDQVVSRLVPVMKWIKKHISKDHVCIEYPKSE